MKKGVIIFSAINIFEGGPLSALIDCLDILNNFHSKDYIIIVFVHNKKILNNNYFNNLKFIEFPKSRRSYFYRLYYEYFYFNIISKRFKPKYWFSFHDITPNLTKTKQFVYCHNPSPFNHIEFIDLILQPKQVIFKFFYRFLYKINLNKNVFIIVQQSWLKKEFIKLFNLSAEKIFIAKPLIKTQIQKYYFFEKNKNSIFFYPAYPRPFKNFELICKSVMELSHKNITNFYVYLTLDGSENNYSKYIYNKYKHLKNIIFLGELSRLEVFDYYSKTDCLLFPSKLETWGLPLSEFKNYKKPILASNLPYAKETVGKYDKIKFFNPFSHKQLACYMEDIINNTIVFDETYVENHEVPYANNWQELFDKIFI